MTFCYTGYFSLGRLMMDNVTGLRRYVAFLLTSRWPTCMTRNFVEIDHIINDTINMNIAVASYYCKTLKYQILLRYEVIAMVVRLWCYSLGFKKAVTMAVTISWALACVLIDLIFNLCIWHVCTIQKSLICTKSKSFPATLNSIQSWMQRKYHTEGVSIDNTQRSLFKIDDSWTILLHGF